MIFKNKNIEKYEVENGIDKRTNELTEKKTALINSYRRMQSKVVNQDFGLCLS